MDTPLYVLSTAASMVENADKATTNNDLQPSENKSPSPRGRSPKIHCGHRHDQKEHATLKTPNHSNNMCGRGTRKCTGTQTSFSSFTGSPYQRPTASRQDSMDDPFSRPGSRASPNSRCTPSPRQNGCSPPPYGGYPHNVITDMDCSDMPLNLTVSSASHQNHKSRETPRSTILGRGSEGRVPTPEIASTAATGTISSSRPLHNASTGDSLSSDPEIEEHFRRSLGTKYPDYLAPRSPVENSGNSDSHMNNISITGNVDDHFAKSLGDTWAKLNSKPTVNNKMDHVGSETFSGTVDDHFAKALGDTWYKIKAQKEHASSSSRMESSHLTSYSSSREFSTVPVRL